MKKKLIIFIPILILICVIFSTQLLKEKEGIKFNLKNQTGITIDSISLYLSNSTEKIFIYKISKFINSDEISEYININDYPKLDYSLGVSFDVGGKYTEKIIQYLPSSTNGEYNLYINLEDINKNINANITYKDIFTECTENLEIGTIP